MQADVDTPLLAILSRSGYLEAASSSSSDGGDGGPLGLVLAATSFYAEAGGQVGGWVGGRRGEGLSD